MSTEHEETEQQPGASGAAGADPGERIAGALRAAYVELVEAFARDTDAAATSPWPELPLVRALGVAWHRAGGSPADVVREVARLGRELEATIAARAPLTSERASRLSSLLVEATAIVVEAHATAARERREEWLSFYTHELRNPLNTMVNATWILRNQATTAQAQRVCDMMDRAIQRMEGLIHDVRALERKAREDPPRRPRLG